MAYVLPRFVYSKQLLSHNLRICYQKIVYYHKYNYIQISKIPMMHFQTSLPRLPIPKLELTCQRYLAAQKPLLTDKDYKKIETSVLKFKDTVGKELHTVLVKNDKNNKHTSYISEPWFKNYLISRKPLPLNYNPALIFQNDCRKEYNNQLTRCTNMLISSLRFYKSLQEGVLEPEVFHLNPKKSDTKRFRSICSMTPKYISWYAAYLFNTYPLDMSQYHSLFNATRIPELNKDRFFQNPKMKHVLVQSKGYFYVFDVLNESGDILPREKILARLNFIFNDRINANKYPIGILTTLERNKWAKLRHNILNLNNDKSLDLIDGALFNICLDEETVSDDLQTLIRQFLHSDGKNRFVITLFIFLLI